MTTPTVEVTVTGTSTAANERVTIVIVEDDGSSRTYDYLTSGVESATDIATGIASLINDPSVTVSNTGAVITFTANDNDYVFYVQVYDTYDDNNVRSSDPDDTNINLSVTDYVPVRGTLSLTGTPTTILTTTQSYTIGVTTLGNFDCTTSTDSVTIEINPASTIELTSSNATLNQNICDLEALDSTTFFISGGASNYSVQWTNGRPNGIDFNPAPGAILAFTAGVTITLSGTPDTNITTTTTYPYIITTENNGNGCGESTISGTIVIEPRHFIQISNTSVGILINLYVVDLQ